MDSECDNYGAIYCVDEDEYRVYCENCDELCIERYYKNHLKSGTHTDNFSKRQRIKLLIKINCFHQSKCM